MVTPTNTKIKRIRIIAAAVLVVSLLAGVFLLMKNYEEKQGEYPSQDSGAAETTLTHNGREYVLKDGIETFLLMGLDKSEQTAESYNNDCAADFIVLLVFDNNNSTVTPVQINRDTMVKINKLGVSGEKVGELTGQISTAHQQGNGTEMSCRNVADSLSDVLMGIKINHYASVVMDAVPVYNDMAGGVALTVLDDFSAVDETLVKGKTVTLSGVQALTYVRARKGMEDSSNIARMERQRQYMQALYKQTKQCVSEDEEFVVKTTTSLSKYIVSDCTVNRLQQLMKKITTYTASDMQKLEGESIKGEQYMEFYPDKDSVEELVISLFYTLAE